MNEQDGQGTPWWQIALPLVTGLASAATPGLARGAGAALGALGMVQDFRRQSREDRERSATRSGVRRISEVFRGPQNSAPFNMDPEVQSALDRSGFAPGPKASDEEIDLINLRAQRPYGSAEQLQQIAGRRPMRLQQVPRTLEELRSISEGAQPGEKFSADAIAGMPGVEYDYETPKPAEISDHFDLWRSQNPGAQASAYVPPSQPKQTRYEDWGYGTKKVIHPDGREETVRVPTAPRDAPAPGSLPLAVQRRVDAKKTRTFEGLPVVKKVQVQAEAASFADSLDPNTTNPADDQALIYAFAKAMDPDSVVREGEYAVVQKYAQSWAERFGFNAARVFSNTQFLSPLARGNMKATIRTRYSVGKKQYDNVRGSYAGQINNKLTGQQDGESYLTDYGAGFGAAQPEAPQGASAGAPGGRPPLSSFEKR